MTGAAGDCRALLVGLAWSALTRPSASPDETASRRADRYQPAPVHIAGRERRRGHSSLRQIADALTSAPIASGRAAWMVRQKATVGRCCWALVSLSDFVNSPLGMVVSGARSALNRGFR